MRKTTINFGNPSGGIRYIFKWAEDLWRPANEVNIEIDFSNFTFAKPFELIYVVNQINEYMAAFPGANISFIGYEELNHAGRMGLFRHIGNQGIQSEGVYLHDNHHDHKYLPITVTTRKGFRGETANPRDTHDIIEINSGDLARQLTQCPDGYVFDTIQYSLREIIRNIYEHSGANEFMYAASYFHSSKIAEICVSDTGSGIHSSLTRNPKFSSLSPKQAIQWS